MVISTMASKHIETRRKLKAIPDIKTFNSVLDQCVLSDDERQLLQLHYIKGKDFRYIADYLGFAEVTIKCKHRTALEKISTIL